TSFDEGGSAAIVVSGTLVAPQTFVINGDVLKNTKASAGKIDGDRWTLPAGVGVAKNAWKPVVSAVAYKVAPVQKAASKATLPAGYSIESWYPPKDNYGRDQLFEGLGIGVAKDGTIVVATRTAGIWRIV